LRCPREQHRTRLPGCHRAWLFEAALFHFHAIHPGYQTKKLVLARGAGLHLAAFAGSNVGQRYGRAMQSAAGLISDCADHRSVKRLTIESESENRDYKQDDADSEKKTRLYGNRPDMLRQISILQR
jgi:hypothetical protein